MGQSCCGQAILVDAQEGHEGGEAGGGQALVQ